MESLAERLQLELPRTTLARAEELLRQALRIGLDAVVRGNKASAEQALPVLCLDLACEESGCSLGETRSACAQAGTDLRKYAKLRGIVASRTSLPPTQALDPATPSARRSSAGADTVDQLFVKLGCVQARPVYAALMEAFRAKYPQSIPESRRAHVDLGSRDIKLAVFMSACTALGLKVDGRLRAEIGASTELVRRLEDKVGLLCKDEIQDLTRRADAATTPSGRPARLNRSHSMAEPSTPTRPTKRPPPPVDCAPGTSAADDDGAAMAALEHIANAEADPDTSKPSKPASKGAGRGKPQRVRRTTGINILVKPVDAASARLRVQLASWQATLLGTPAAAAEAVQSN